MEERIGEKISNEKLLCRGEKITVSNHREPPVVIPVIRLVHHVQVTLVVPVEAEETRIAVLVVEEICALAHPHHCLSYPRK